VLRGSGPYLQKILQQFGDKIKDPELRMVLDQLKTGLDPIDETERKALLADILKQPGMDGAQLLEVRSLSAASVAEAVACKIQMSGEDQPREYIVKLLRPGIEQRAGRERQYFEQVAARYGGVAGTFATVADQIEGELDLRQEAVQVKRGQVYSDAGRVGVKAMQLAQGFKPQKNVLIIEKAPGQTVKSFIDATKNPTLSQQERDQLITQGRALASQLAQLGGVWLKEVALGEGFYHGDMHAGNLLTDPEKGLTLIDFGNAGVIEPQEQSKFLLFQAAMRKNKPALAVQALKGLLPPKERQLLQDLAVQVEADVAALMVKEADNRLKQDLAFAVIDAINKRRIAMPPAFVNLCRAQDMLVQAQAAVMDRVKDLIAATPDPKPDPCDSAEMEREMDQAVSASTFDLVKKLGIGKALQLTSYGSRDKLVSAMMKQPQVRQGMQDYEERVQAYQASLDEHQEAIKRFEAEPAWTGPQEELDRVRLQAVNALAAEYAEGLKTDFPSVDPTLRPALHRVFKALHKAELKDVEALASLLDPLDPNALPNLREAQLAFDAIDAQRPPAPVAPTPVFVEELYTAVVEQAADAARAPRGQALGAMFSDPTVFPAHLELAAQPA
jgi:predicted unusual protein kinase regulating ubiquinone biosynthesis (AarF/ABC1/UbiB family)